MKQQDSLGEHSIVLRDAAQADRAALFDIYASTRAEELAVMDWSVLQKESFLRMQFDAQDRYYHEQYSDASFQVIEVDGKAAGRLYVRQDEADVNIIDIALLPEYRAIGIGSVLIEGLQSQAAGGGKTVSIYVEKFNRARELYRRLGFGMVRDEGVYLLMRWPDKGLAGWVVFQRPLRCRPRPSKTARFGLVRLRSLSSDPTKRSLRSDCPPHPAVSGPGKVPNDRAIRSSSVWMPCCTGGLVASANTIENGIRCDAPMVLLVHRSGFDQHHLTRLPIRDRQAECSPIWGSRAPSRSSL